MHKVRICCLSSLPLMILRTCAPAASLYFRENADLFMSGSEKQACLFGLNKNKPLTRLWQFLKGSAGMSIESAMVSGWSKPILANL